MRNHCRLGWSGMADVIDQLSFVFGPFSTGWDAHWENLVESSILANEQHRLMAEIETW